MKGRISINRQYAVPFLLVSFILFLVSRYFGGIFIKAARFWFLLYIIDLIILIINAVSLRYSQLFTHKHVQKGEIVQYDLNISGWSLLPVPHVHTEFTRIHQQNSSLIPEQDFSLKPKSRRKFSREVYAGVRGVYTLGLSRLSVTGFTGLITIGLSIWAKTFYVYPRLPKLHFTLSRHQPTAGNSRTMTGKRGEYHTFSGLHEYRTGDPSHLISWKRYAQLGRPVVREFDSLGGAGIHLFLDRRHAAARELKHEDTAIEAALGLIYAASMSGQQVTVHGFPGWEGKCIESEDDIHRLLNSTLTLEFDAPDLSELMEIPKGSTLYIITLLSDYILLDTDFWNEQPSGHLIAVTEGMDPRTLTRTDILISQLEQHGISITRITANHHLEEELACTFSS